MDYEHDDRRAADVPGVTGAEGSGLPAGREPLDADSPSPWSPEVRAFDPQFGSGAGTSEPGVSGPADDLFDTMFLTGGARPSAFATEGDDLDFPPPQAPDLASAFLAALDAIDDRRFVTPVPDEPYAPSAELIAPVTPAPPAESVSFAAPVEPAAVGEPVYELQPQSRFKLESERSEETSDPVEETSAESVDAEGAAHLPWDTVRVPVAGLLTAGSDQASLSELSELSELSDQSSVFDQPSDGAPVDELPGAEEFELEPSIGMEPMDAAPMAFDAPDAFAPAAVAAAAPEPEPEPESDELEDLQDYVVFSLGDMRCVVPIRNVVEVGRIPDAAPVPNAPVWLYGLGNLRGQVLSLIDLRAFFGVGRIKASAGRMVVLRGDSDDITAGVMVDQVHQIVALSPSRFKQAPSELALPDKSTEFVWGACDYGNYTMIGLDVDGVLGVESLTEEAV